MDDVTPKKIALVAIGSILTVGLLFGAWFLTSTPKQAPKQDMALKETDHTTANKKATVALVEYSDFQCPACARYQPMLKEVLKKYGDKMMFVQRHFPLDQHKNAMAAARAAEAAGKQGKFFEMGDLLFANQSDWAEENDPQKFFTQYAQQLKLNMNQYKKDNTNAQNAKIEADRNSGVILGVNSTPTFFLNGVKLSNPASVDAFGQLIEAELNAK